MDLKFSIVAQVVEAGWNRAKSLVENLKNSFASMFNGASAGWGKIAGIAATAAVGMYKIGERLRQSFLEDLKRMASALENFVQDSNRNFRKIRFQDTDSEKARNLEDIGKQIRERKKRVEEINASQDTESIFGRAILDPLEKTGRAITGRGFNEAEEAERDRLKNEINALERQFMFASGKKTKDESEAVGKAQQERIAIEEEGLQIELAMIEEAKAATEKAEADKAKAREERLAKDRARHDQEMAWIEEESAAAKKQQETAAAIAGAARDFAYSQASPADKVKMDKQRLAQLAKEFSSGTGDRGAIAQEAFAVKGRIADAETAAKKTVEDEKKRAEEARKANAGQSLSVGDLFTNLYGQNIQRGPEQETADNTKQALEVLKEIAKKTGAAP